MSTEYRRGIPSVAHVEAATRLGLLWYAEGRTGNWRFHGVNGDVQLNLQRTPGRGPLTSAERNRSYRPIRTDGTPVDWEVLDAEVARVTQPATVTPTAPATPTTQPQGFRADLWRRICEHFSFVSYDGGEVASLSELSDIDDVGIHSRHWQWGWGTADREAPTRQNRTDILTRWTVYQELKPLYDLVDGAQGEVAMPRDVELAWAYCVAPSAPFAEGWFLFRDESGLRARLSWGLSWRPEEDGYGVPLRNFAAVLDAVAEQRVAEREATAAEPTSSVSPLREQRPPQPASPEPRREEAQHVEAIVADAIQNRLTQAPQPRILNLDDLTTLLRRHLGDDVSIVSLRRPRGVYRVQIDFADDTRTAGITAQNLPHNVSIWRSTRGRTCDFDLRGTDASTTLVCNLATHPASAATSQPTYFAVDGDTMTTPSGAPPWLHQMCAEMRATATWCRTKASFALVFELAYGQTLEKSMTVRAVRNISLPGFPTVTVTATNRPAPPVPVCLVAAMRRNQDLAALQPDDAIPGERDATVAWAQMDPTTSQLCRNVVREIVEHGCYGLDDAAAAKRAGHYATLIAEAAAAKVETSSHVRAWCAQFQTRVALLEVDEGEVVNSAATSATLRLGTKPPTPAAIAKFRELMSSKMCPGRTEATKQSGLDCEATQHVLLRWCSGLDDAAATEVVGAVWRSFGAAYSTHQPLTRIDAIAQAALPRPALDVSGATTLDPALERARQAQEARRRSLAELQAQLQRERALRACADVAAAVEQPSRFALLEVDEAADPAASIARWQAGRAAAAGRRSVDVSPTAAKWQPPTAALHRIDFDVPVRHDYVDVSDMPIEVQGAVIIETLVDVARRAGGMWEN